MMEKMQLKHNKKISVTYMLFVLSIVISCIYAFDVFALESNDSSNSLNWGQGQSQNNTNVASTWNCGYPKNPQEDINKLKDECWFCSSLITGVDAIEKLSTKIYDAVIGPLAGLMTVLLALWLVFKILEYIAAAKYKGVEEFYTDIGKIILKVGIGVSLLLAGTDLWNYSVSPMASFVFDYGASVLDAGDHLKNSGFDSLTISEKSPNPVGEVGAKMVGESKDEAGGIVAKINEKLMELLGFGWVMLTAAMKSGTACIPYSQFKVFVVGILLVVLAIYYLVIIPIKFIDIIFRFGVFLALMPLFVAAWPFPITGDFTKKGIKMLLNVMLSFLVFAVVVTLCTELIYSELKIPNISGTDTEVIAKIQSDFLVDWSNIFLIVIYMVFAFNVIRLVDNLSGQLSDAHYEPSDFAQDNPGTGNEAGVNKPFRIVQSQAQKLSNKIFKKR